MRFVTALARSLPRSLVAKPGFIRGQAADL
jgi:hypothetical protein